MSSTVNSDSSSDPISDPIPPIPADISAAQAAEKRDPYLAFRYPDFRLLASARVVALVGEQMVNVAIGWELYERTGDPLALGLVGLVQVFPVIALSLFTGQAADRLNRKHLTLAMMALLGLCSVGLAAISFTQGSLPLFYFILFLTGVGNAFFNPAASALFAQTVPSEAYTNAATWSSSTWQIASLVGPTLGGVLIGVFKIAGPIYVIHVFATLGYILLVSRINGQQASRAKEPMTRDSLLSGFSFVRRNPIILSAITLDMFAVLLGGATALLPVFAKDILQVGPEGLGWLRAAPSLGAVLMAVLLAHLPPFSRAGMTLLWSVAGFGAATIVFGLSTSFLLSLLMLAILGALDNVSVVIRHTLVLLHTPDEMRGRVSSVNNVFIGASNELGAFESGVAAALVGPVLAVAGGGIGTIIVVLVIARAFPEVRALGALAEH
jgi:MFS family permease